VLAKHPLCSDPFGIHAEIGEVVVATDLHHIIPLATKDLPTRVLNSEANLMPLCHSCHSRITASGAGGAANDGGGG
jgi:5-methylcytosine-specific restriction endonuclease McrA